MHRLFPTVVLLIYKSKSEINLSKTTIDKEIDSQDGSTSRISNCF